MKFINPIVIFGLAQTEIEAIDGTAIKKARKRLLAESELSDNGEITIGNILLSRTEIEAAAKLLENEKHRRCYHLIANDGSLQRFLTKPFADFFWEYERKENYLSQEFLEIVSPFFAKNFGDFLAYKFKAHDEKMVRLMLTMVPLVTREDEDILYSEVRAVIDEELTHITEVTDSLDDISHEDVDIRLRIILNFVEKAFDPTMLNQLGEHFAGQRNNIANAIRNLSVEIYNRFERELLARDLLNSALEIKTSAMTNQKLKEDLVIIDGIVRQKERNRINEPVLASAKSLINRILLELKKAERGEKISVVSEILMINTKLAPHRTRLRDGQEIEIGIGLAKTKIDFQGINDLPADFVEIKNQVALALRALAIQFWNSENDGISAMKLIQEAQKINSVSVETRMKIEETSNQLLKQLLKKTTPNPVMIPQNTTKVSTTSSSTSISGTNSQGSSNYTPPSRPLNPAIPLALGSFAVGGIILAAGGGIAGLLLILLGFGFLKAL